MSQIIQPGVYDFKSCFCVLLGIPKNQCDRRKEDLLLWLSNFYDYELLNGCPIRINIKEVYGEYQQMPRKIKYDTIQMEEKIKDYTNFTIASLGPKFKPNSKSKVAREAIEEFGYEKYGHTSQRAIASRFIAPTFNTYGESDGKKKWVWYSSYEELDDAASSIWRKIREEEKISDQEAANAFYRQESGEDITKEKNSYKRALERFKELYQDVPVLVESWKLKTKEN